MWKFEIIVILKCGVYCIYVYENIDFLLKRWYDYEEWIIEI